jgi:hypothetical protein
MFALVQEHHRFHELRRRLTEADPEIDETTLLDTLEGATNLNEAIGEVSLPRWAERSRMNLPCRSAPRTTGSFTSMGTSACGGRRMGSMP